MSDYGLEHRELRASYWPDYDAVSREGTRFTLLEMTKRPMPSRLKRLR